MVSNQDQENLRPSKLDEVVGNENLKACLKITTNSARKRGRVHPHIILDGPPGCGKTTIARALANEMGGRKFVEVNGASIKRIPDLISIFQEIEGEEDAFIFIDEIHRLKTKLEEVIYSALEDFKLFLPTYGDLEEELITPEISPFTMIGATTNIGAMSGPMRSRFHHRHSVDFYSEEDLRKIISINSSKYRLILKNDADLELAKRSKRVPRLANNYLGFIRDYAEDRENKYISPEDIDIALKMLDIDELGLDKMDRKYLKFVEEHQPIGVGHIATSIGTTVESLTKFVEPYLLAKGLIQVHPKGRALSDYVNDREMDDLLSDEIEI